MSTCDDFFFGSATVGERGQVVIPADARAELGISPGDKLLIMRHPVHKGIMMAKFEAMDDFLEDLKMKVQEARSKPCEEPL